jgi:hypothetical protein
MERELATWAASDHADHMYQKTANIYLTLWKPMDLRRAPRNELAAVNQEAISAHAVQGSCGTPLHGYNDCAQLNR